MLFLQKDVLLEPNIREYLPGQRSVILTYGVFPGSISLKNFTIAVFAAVKVDVSDVSLIATLNITYTYHSNIFILIGTCYIRGYHSR